MTQQPLIPPETIRLAARGIQMHVDRMKAIADAATRATAQLASFRDDWLAARKRAARR